MTYMRNSKVVDIHSRRIQTWEDNFTGTALDSIGNRFVVPADACIDGLQKISL